MCVTVDHAQEKHWRWTEECSPGLALVEVPDTFVNLSIRIGDLKPGVKYAIQLFADFKVEKEGVN